MNLRLAADPVAFPVERGLTPRETATALGCDRTLVLRMVRRGELRGYRLGRVVRIYESSIDDYRRRNEIQAESTDVAAKPRPKTERRRVVESVSFLRSIGVKV